MYVVDRVRDILRHETFPILLWRIFAKLIGPFVAINRQILYQIDLTKPIAQREARVECVIEEATEENIEELLDVRCAPLKLVIDGELSDRDDYELALQLRSFAQKRAGGRLEILSWFRAGEVCFVARVNGRIAHSNWIRFPYSGPAPNRSIDPEEGAVYTTDGITIPEWRGRGLHEAVLSRMLRFVQARGYERAYTITDYTNERPRRGLFRVGDWRFQGHYMFVIPRGISRSWLLRLSGDIGPIERTIESCGIPV